MVIPPSPPIPTNRIKQTAADLGFLLCGITRAQSSPGFERLKTWLELGYSGSMRYLADRLPAYEHPNSILDGVRSIIVLGTPYKAPWAVASKVDRQSMHGRVASYAQSEHDYHDVLRERMKEFVSQLETMGAIGKYRSVVDTAPLLEREAAQLAGLGWIGKNTLLLNRQYGSYFFLSAVLTDLEFEIDQPMSTDHCGTCTACLDACPTQAFPQPYVLDARKCISYLTIEHRDDVDEDLRAKLDGWIFGCDVCQEVCPWNRRPVESSDADLQPRFELRHLPLREILTMDEGTFRSKFRKRPLSRPKWSGMLRNAILVAVSQDAVELLPEIDRLQSESYPKLVRDAAQWASKS